MLSEVERGELERLVRRHHLHERVLRFIEYDNRTMARPRHWTYRGEPLVA